jgi:DNA-directed RNA polymerase specialized sigma24 family protein
MTDRELLNVGNVAELTASHRSALVAVIARKVGDAKAAEILADLALEEAFRNVAEWDHEQESFRAWVLENAQTTTEPWVAPAASAYCDVQMEVRETMWADHGDDYETWPDGELQRRLDAAMRETFSQPPYVFVDNDGDYFAD